MATPHGASYGRVMLRSTLIPVLAAIALAGCGGAGSDRAGGGGEPVAPKVLVMANANFDLAELEAFDDAVARARAGTCGSSGATNSPVAAAGTRRSRWCAPSRPAGRTSAGRGRALRRGRRQGLRAAPRAAPDRHLRRTRSGSLRDKALIDPMLDEPRRPRTAAASACCRVRCGAHSRSIRCAGRRTTRAPRIALERRASDRRVAARARRHRCATTIPPHPSAPRA